MALHHYSGHRGTHLGALVRDIAQHVQLILTASATVVLLDVANRPMRLPEAFSKCLSKYRAALSEA
jgi:hypothetical protein